MSGPDPRSTHLDRPEHADADGLDPEQGRGSKNQGDAGRSRWLMVACCIPMLVIAVALVATGVVGAGFIVIAVACTLMMVAMMAAMSPGGGR
jgi:hypothetical protein